ncbi:multidrug transporter [Fusibacter ferrireducens]|uniref:Multidrug transporter n=1 Tax=Fusibacter ferrireducens TaxID=2785058 RepID=A0ABR9ZWI2_9FIRM|nr:multidrug transporter [Fusibacter ferrireducens]MBF4694245.1 multidrug transporter [Fusibacter ferrireducens]
MEPSKKDWKLFREKIGSWQESYMEKLVKEYIAFLNSDLPASSKFWELEKKIKQDKKKPGVILEVRKCDMLFDIIRLINDDVITMDDLSDFTDELRENVKRYPFHI